MIFDRVYRLGVLPVESNILSAVVVLIICSIAVGLILYGNRKKSRKLNWLGFALLLLGIFVFLNHFPQYANTFSTWAMLVLAIAAFMAIDENRRLREENRRNWALDEVRRWAVDAIEVLAAPSLQDLSIEEHRWEMKENLRPIITKGYIAHNDIEKLNSNLEKQVITVVDSLSKFYDLLDTGIGKDKPVETWQNLILKLTEVVTSASRLRG